MEEINVLIYGAGGHGRVVFDCCLRCGYEVSGFIDDDLQKRQIMQLPVYTFYSLIDFDGLIALGIGDNNIRERKYYDLKSADLNLLTVIDQTSIISQFSEIGEGSVVFPSVVVNNSAKIGKGCILNTAAVIEHDCVIGDFSHISPNASLAGGAVVGQKSQVGIGACVRENIKIGNNVTVGAGAVVVKDVPDNVVVVGNPARILKKQ